MGNSKNTNFSASSQYAWASNTLWDLTERFTVMMFRKDGASSANWSDWVFLSKGTYFTIGHASGSHHLHRFDVNGTAYTSDSNFGLPIDSWHCHVSTWDKDLDSGKLQQFHNNTEHGGTAVYRTTATGTNTTDLILGGLYNNNTRYAHVRIWNRKLSSAERLAEQRCPGSVRRGLVFWWRGTGGDGDRDLITGAAPTITGTATSIEENLNIGYRYHFPGLWLPGKAPVSGGDLDISIPAGAAQFAGNIPLILQTIRITPAAGAAQFTGNAPAPVQIIRLAIPAGAAQFTGYAPTIDISANLTLQPGAGAAQFTGYAPTVVTTGNALIQPGVGAAVFTGYAPTLKTGINPAAGSAQFAGNAPTLKTGINPAAGSAQFAGNAPTVDISQDVFIQTPAGTLQFTGNTLTVLTSENQLIAVPVGQLVLTGRTPTVVNTSDVGDNDTYLQVDPINPDTLNLYVEGVLLARFSQQNINVNGGLGLRVVTKTANYTATVKDAVILCDASGGAFTITLPASGAAQGLMLFIKKTDSSVNAVTVDGDASEQIDGAGSISLPNQYDAARLVADGVGWSVI